MKALIIFGTRPEAIKLSPLIRVLTAEPEIECQVCVTSQHREMLQQVSELFNVRPDVDLDLMTEDQRPLEFFASASRALQDQLSVLDPDLAIVQGDTMTCFVGALASFLHMKPVLHVEAGLRTHDKYAPYPEELLRTMVSDIAEMHFAPTRRAKQNLINEGIDPAKIWITGNTVVDALQSIHPWLEKHRQATIHRFNLRNRFVLITGHRRENFGSPFMRIFQALRELASDHPEVDFVYPVHPNPKVSIPAHDQLSGLANMKLVEPLDYLTFLILMSACEFVITDSGGVQEEAPSLGKMVLVTREVTERPELIATGLGILVGSDSGQIISIGKRLLSDGVPDEGEIVRQNPFGDGGASGRIRDVILSGSCQEFIPNSDSSSLA